MSIFLEKTEIVNFPVKEGTTLPLMESSLFQRGDFHLPQSKTFLLPTLTPTTTQNGAGFKVELFDVKLAHRHLLWYALFHKINSIEWFILYRNLEFSIKRSREISIQSVILFDILRKLSNTRDRLPDWQSRTKPIHKELKIPVKNAEKFLNSKEELTLLDIYMEYCKIPQKALSKKLILNVKNSILPQIHVSEERFVGQGYKDKGSQAPGDKLPVIETWVPEENVVSLLDLKKEYDRIFQI